MERFLSEFRYIFVARTADFHSTLTAHTVLPLTEILQRSFRNPSYETTPKTERSVNKVKLYTK